MAIEKTFNATKFQNHRVSLRYDLDKNVVWVICSKHEIAARYVTKLIVDKRIGSIDTVVYRASKDAKVIALMRGEHLNRFLRSGEQKALPEPQKSTKKSFSQIASESETGS